MDVSFQEVILFLPFLTAMATHYALPLAKAR